VFVVSHVLRGFFPEWCDVSDPRCCKMSASVVSAGWVTEFICACVSGPWLLDSLTFPKPARYGVCGRWSGVLPAQKLDGQIGKG